MSAQACFLDVPIYDANAEPISKEHPMPRFDVRLDGTLVDYFADAAEAEGLADLEAETSGNARSRYTVVEVLDAAADPMIVGEADA